MMLTMQERLKDLRVERGLTLEQTGLSRSALGSYESDEFKDISHYVLVKLAKFSGVTAADLLGLAETRNHPNAERLSDVMIELLQSGRIDNALLCDLATYPDFPRLMAELEVYVNGMAVKLVRTANSIVDAASANIVKQYDPGYLFGRDMAEIARSLREAHKDDFFNIPLDNPLEVAAVITGKEESVPPPPRIERGRAGLYLQAAVPELYEADR